MSGFRSFVCSCVVAALVLNPQVARSTALADEDRAALSHDRELVQNLIVELETEEAEARKKVQRVVVAHSNVEQGSEGASSTSASGTSEQDKSWFTQGRPPPGWLQRLAQILERRAAEQNEDSLLPKEKFDDQWTVSPKFRTELLEGWKSIVSTSGGKVAGGDHDQQPPTTTSISVVVEVGTYIGYTTRFLSKNFDVVLALDDNPTFLQLNQVYNRDRGNINFIQTDTTSLDWAKGGLFQGIATEVAKRVLRNIRKARQDEEARTSTEKGEKSVTTTGKDDAVSMELEEQALVADLLTYEPPAPPVAPVPVVLQGNQRHGASSTSTSTSEHTSQNLVNWLVFLDASHDFASVTKELLGLLGSTNVPARYFLFDDFSAEPSGVQPAVLLFVKHGYLRRVRYVGETVLPLRDGRTVLGPEGVLCERIREPEPGLGSGSTVLEQERNVLQTFVQLLAMEQLPQETWDQVLEDLRQAADAKDGVCSGVVRSDGSCERGKVVKSDEDVEGRKPPPPTAPPPARVDL
ncbi:unnamed protein product [Amoebophrya sp. A25]|nr:unnamed protein product [Amoebophrya sp. A25]|eukprot:GSA25T00016989001.1